jgi:hypothetical protein
MIATNGPLGHDHALSPQCRNSGAFWRGRTASLSLPNLGRRGGIFTPLPRAAEFPKVGGGDYRLGRGKRSARTSLTFSSCVIDRGRGMAVSRAFASACHTAPSTVPTKRDGHAVTQRASMKLAMAASWVLRSIARKIRGRLVVCKPRMAQNIS